jgi:sulfur carrier protein
MSELMEIIVNGEPRRVPEDTTVAGLIEMLGLTGRRIAVEVNQEIIARDRHRTHTLGRGDRIEIVHAIGGG